MRNSQQTTFDLNGPILSFTTQPVGVASTGVVSGTGSGIATFIGIATATFTTGVSSGSPTAPSNPASNTGIITYRWYEVGVGALSDSTYVTGTATTTLTFSRLITPTDNQRRFYLEADYIPSAYQTSSPVTAGTARSTGNAINEPLSSSVGILTVFPLIEIVAQPSNSSAPVGSTATFNIVSTLTDNSFPDDLVYQWHYNGNPITDGTIIDGYEQSTVTVPSVKRERIVRDIREEQPTFRTESFDVFEDRTFEDTITKNDTYTNDGSVSLPSSSYEVFVSVASGSGGNGGGDDGGEGGRGGAGRFGRFTYNSGGRTLNWAVGRRGGDGRSGGGGTGGPAGAGGASGGRGGDAGNWSGAGGGGGGATIVYDSTVGRQTIIAAGGSGGGGGSWQRGGTNGANAGGFGSASITTINRGRDGNAAGSDGGGGGASGGGSAPLGAAGNGGRDRVNGGTGGGQTFGAFDPSRMTFGFDGTEHQGDGYVRIEYKYKDTRRERVYVRTDTRQVQTGTQSVKVGETIDYIDVPTTTTEAVKNPINVTFSGSNTRTLSITADRVVGLATVFCRVSSATATNSPVRSDIVEYRATPPTSEQSNISVETIGVNNTATLSSINLINGEYAFTLSTGNIGAGRLTNYFSFYAPDKNINVEMDLYGGKGTNSGSIQGGEGGFSRIRFTMTQNTEYVIAGLTNDINTPFIYRKGNLIACVGKGGNAGTSGRGGFGGGIGIAGNAGFGRDAGVGGALITAGNLGGDGVFGSLTSLVPTTPDTKATAPNGGRALKCTKGVYWKDQGVSACADVGTVKFRLSDGVEVTNTASIARGYKAGYDIIQTAGRGSSNGGAGGNGVTGGAGGQNGAGGGGGSGYTDGSVTVVNTQLGGSTGEARVVIRLVS